MRISLLTNSRVHPPQGLRGGEPGAAGENLLIRQNGTEERLGHFASAEVLPGDRIVIRTPGGGGFGYPAS
jgi:5-oxoprolinase (ATP-hydrolysing)